MPAKRIALISVAVAIAILSVGIFVWSRSPNPTTPRFLPLRNPVSVTQFSYDFLGARPFETGKMWISAAVSGKTNWTSILYDIERQQVLGQLTNAWPEILLGEPPRLLCAQPRLPPPWKVLRERVLSFISRVSGRRSAPSSPSVGLYKYWLLDLTSGAATPLGTIPANQNPWHLPSPDYHYCFIAYRPAAFPQCYLVDLQNPSMRRLPMPAWPCDWWDNTRLLLRSTNYDFLLYDIRSKAVSPLVPSEGIASFFRENKIQATPIQAQAFAIWTGTNNDFYLTDTHQKWLAAESFLIKVQYPNGALSLISPHFKFEWSDHLDSSGHRYLYSGRESGDASDGVFLRDLDSGTNRILVDPTTNRYFSIPRFYNDSAIYFRSNALWRINLDGSRNVRLFPAPDSPEENGQAER